MEENISKLSTAVYVLNHIDTAGKQNLLNLGGAIDMIEGVIKSLSGSETEQGEKHE